MIVSPSALNSKDVFSGSCFGKIFEREQQRWKLFEINFFLFNSILILSLILGSSEAFIFVLLGITLFY